MDNRKESNAGANIHVFAYGMALQSRITPRAEGFESKEMKRILKEAFTTLYDMSASSCKAASAAFQLEGVLVAGRDCVLEKLLLNSEVTCGEERMNNLACYVVAQLQSRLSC